MVTLPLFPEPYPNELFYSVLARYKVRCGLLPDKLLLEDVFRKKTVIASPEMPNGIARAVENVRPSTMFSATDIISKHTLFPLYTAFSEARIKEKMFTQMLACKNNTYTTSLGIATCALKQNHFFRHCPVCVKEQLELFGEPFWGRRWFGLFTNCCPLHGVHFVLTSDAIHGLSRHTFRPLLDDLAFGSETEIHIKKAVWQEHLIAKTTMHLMHNHHQFSFPQLTNFYCQLALERNFNRGHYLRQNDISHFIKGYWTWRWLKKLGFTKSYFDGNVASLFRKHRKQHMYVMHMIAALPFFNGNIGNWWDALTNSPTPSIQHPKNYSKSSFQHSEETLENWKHAWLNLLRQYGPKAARYSNCDSEKLYTALYRADKRWLLQVNHQHRVQRKVDLIRVSWQKRDFAMCKLLFRALYEENDIYSPRRSRRWFLSCLPNSATIEKNLRQLPLTNKFLKAYSEPYEDYQCRRLIQSARFFTAKNIRVNPWKLYRAARINTQRSISSVVTTTCGWCIDWIIKNTK